MSLAKVTGSSAVLGHVGHVAVPAISRDGPAGAMLAGISTVPATATATAAACKGLIKSRRFS